MSLSRLETFYGELDAKTLLRIVIKEEFARNVALFSSFGTGSALLIDMVAEIDPSIPVLFLDTEKHFPETLEYVDTLTKHFSLTNVVRIKPSPELLGRIDPKGDLWSVQPNRCCWLRKVEPLQRVIKAMGLKALITGRKAYQTPERGGLTAFQVDEDGVFRINPLHDWTREQVKARFAEKMLPEHPLFGKGYASIGCQPCTRPIKPGENERDGRWAHTMNLYGEQKTECGIHLARGDWEV